MPEPILVHGPAGDELLDEFLRFIHIVDTRLAAEALAQQNKSPQPDAASDYGRTA